MQVRVHLTPHLAYRPLMNLTSPRVLGLLFFIAACPGNSNDTGETTQSDTSAPATTTTGEPPTSTTADDTTSTSPTTAETTQTTDASTGSTTGDPTTGPDPTTTTGEPAKACVEYKTENECEFTAGCKWDSVFSYTRGATGCQADLVEFCVDDQVGAGSTWYRGEPGDYQVIGFETTPTDLPPEWKLCDCEGPIACFCASNAPDCPDRLVEFCDAAKTEAACKGSAINAEFKCAFATIDPQGPKDDMCTGQNDKDVCIPAMNAGSMDCEPVDFTMSYPNNCTNPNTPPVFWREVNGVLEITQLCGPVPLAPEWTACEGTDTPDQPDECKCKCV